MLRFTHVVARAVRVAPRLCLPVRTLSTVASSTSETASAATPAPVAPVAPAAPVAAPADGQAEPVKKKRRRSPKSKKLSPEDQATWQASQPPLYTLSYFDIRGVAEIPRLILAAAGRSFIDDRIPLEIQPDGTKGGEWVQRKPLMPYGSVPVLGIKGELIPQSAAIVRFIARRHNLAGSGEMESALIDGTFEYLMELTNAYKGVKGNEVKELFFWQKRFPQAVALLEKNVRGLKYFGKSNALSYADVGCYYWLWSLRQDNPKVVDEVLASNPKIANIFQSVPRKATIKAYLESRKETPR